MCSELLLCCAMLCHAVLKKKNWRHRWWGRKKRKLQDEILRFYSGCEFVGCVSKVLHIRSEDG